MELKKHPLLSGTILLTITGLSSRVIGFFYRVFLSHTIGAIGLGIYQLVFPVFVLAFALCTAGIQTAISKYVAEYDSQTTETYSGAKKTASSSHAVLYCGMLMSLCLSILCSFFLIRNASFLALHVIKEESCASLLKIISLSLPFACMHAAFNGYYYGKKKTAIPAISQLLEQIVRVLSVYLFFIILREKNLPLTPAHAMWGIVCGEIAACLCCITTFTFRRAHIRAKLAKEISTFALPLTGNRLILNLFASAEAILIPGALISYGLGREDALSTFGILTGMAMPVILLPTVFTGSLSVLLLPSISQAKATGDYGHIRNATKQTVEFCVILGLCCSLGFLFFGRMTGQLLFHNKLAGSYIQSLGFLCPFLFLTGTLGSILNGLGRTVYTFICNLLCCGGRLLTILLLLPRFGLYAYLWSMLASQIAITLAYLWALLRKRK
ncbi:MAG: polysaccharide biosynthesis protein [bacterium]|nr:polysaccharide biosynthesis protein [bacterium]